MLSDFQKSKLDRRFELLDTDGDGYISGADYDAAAANVCRAFDHPQDSPQYEKVQMAYLNLWVRLSKPMDKAGAGRISRKQFVASCAERIVEAEDGYERIVAPIIQAIFDVVDADGSGTLDIEELTTWFSAYGVCTDDAERVFKQLDRDENGVLDHDEIQRAVREFYTGDDPKAPGSLLYGPLPVSVRR